MNIPYQAQNKKVTESHEFWQKVVEDYNSGMPAEKIADRYINPYTGKPYSRQHIFWILREMRKL